MDRTNESHAKRGITDNPIICAEGDILKISKYVDGFCSFVKTCETPITISIQGEWGSGKTSFMNLVKKKIEESSEEDNFSFEIYNTWLYNTMTKSKDLPVSFLKSFSEKINIDKTIKEKFIKRFGKAKMTNFSLGKVDFEMEDSYDAAAELADFKAAIAKSAEKKPVIYFIDDLDRISPETAIELLETIKLLLDIKNCIFIIAVDMEIIESGIRMKYGELYSKEKARNYFDKMIQVHYPIPIELYDKSNFFEKHLGDELTENEYCSEIMNMIEYAINPAPRTMKKVINNYLLKKHMLYAYYGDSYYNANTDLYTALLLMIICIREKNNLFYEQLIINKNRIMDYLVECSSLKEQSDSDIEQEDDDYDFASLSEYLMNILNKDKEEKSKVDVLKTILDFSKVTNNESSSKEIKRYNYDGEMLTASEMNDKIKKKFINLFEEKTKSLNIDINVEEEIIERGTVTDILFNTIKFVDEYYNLPETISNEKDEYIQFSKTINNDKNWKTSARVRSVDTINSGEVYVDITLSKSNGYKLARRIIEYSIKN